MRTVYLIGGPHDGKTLALPEQALEAGPWLTVLLEGEPPVEPLELRIPIEEINGELIARWPDDNLKLD